MGGVMCRGRPCVCHYMYYFICYFPSCQYYLINYCDILLVIVMYSILLQLFHIIFFSTECLFLMCTYPHIFQASSFLFFFCTLIYYLLSRKSHLILEFLIVVPLNLLLFYSIHFLVLLPF